MTVLEAIQRSGEFLARKGVDSPRLQAELLLAHILQIARMKLYLSFDRKLTDEETDGYRALIQRRGTREPLQHIIGSVSFCGLELAVNGHVLIPRPETELLVEQAIAWIKSRPAQSDSIRILDFGTGSGCIAIAIAVACPSVVVCGLDISAEALSVAQANASRHQVHERIQFIRGDGFDSLPAGECFDLLVSNPPYIATREIPTLQPEVRDFDPRPALDGGEDGLTFFRMLAVQAKSRSRPGGAAILELGEGHGSAVRDLFTTVNWSVEHIVRDYSGRERILIARQSD